MQKHKPVIIQCSPIRSGSTIVYNFLRELFPSAQVVKKHSYHPDFSSFPIVTTYRHPLDCIASSIQRYGREPTD